MIALEYDDYLQIVQNLEKIKKREDMESSLNKLDNLLDKVRMANRTMNDGRD